jgi:uncharacterized protein YndB with AHSA1/START domain
MRTATSAVTINAPREVVWAAVTLAQYVRQWQYDSEVTTDWIVGHPIRFSAEWQGQSFEQWGTVLEFDAPTRLRYSLFAARPGLEDLPENYFTMTYELTDVEDATRLTFIQEDPRETEDVEDDDEKDNPVLNALRDVAESITSDDGESRERP